LNDKPACFTDILQNISIGPIYHNSLPLTLLLNVEISTSSSLSLVSMGFIGFTEVVAFSLNNFQRSSFTFFGVLVQDALLRLMFFGSSSSPLS